MLCRRRLFNGYDRQGSLALNILQNNTQRSPCACTSTRHFPYHQAGGKDAFLNPSDELGCGMRPVFVSLRISVLPAFFQYGCNGSGRPTGRWRRRWRMKIVQIRGGCCMRCAGMGRALALDCGAGRGLRLNQYQWRVQFHQTIFKNTICYPTVS